MNSKKASNKKPPRAEGALPGAEVLPYGIEGAAMFNQWVEHLIRAIYIAHPGLGDWWTNDHYNALKAYDHKVVVPPDGFNEVDGVNQPIPMAPTEAAAYRKRERDGRVDKKNKHWWYLVLVEALILLERQGTWLGSVWPVLAGLRIRIPLFYEGMGYQDDCG